MRNSSRPFSMQVSAIISAPHQNSAMPSSASSGLATITSILVSVVSMMGIPSSVFDGVGRR
jgi:hypothetical protein